MKVWKWSVLISLAVVGILLLSACGGGAETPAPPPTEAAEPTETSLPPTPVPETPTVGPTATPEGPPPGTEENPLIVAATDISGFALHGVVCELLAEEAGLSVEGRSFPSDAELVASLAAGEMPHVIISFPAGYLVAHEKYGYEVAVVGTQLGGQLTYTSEIIAGADTGVTSLTDAAGRSFCWANPNFLSGYKVPRLMLWAAGINPETDLGEESDVKILDAVTRGVYEGDCEMGAISGNGRTRLQNQYPDVLDKVVVAESPPIPSVALSFSPDLPDAIQAAVIEGYRAVLARDDGAQALQMGYGWESVDDVEDTLFDPLRDLIEAAKKGIEALL